MSISNPLSVSPVTLDLLPQPLRDTVYAFDEGVERDIFLYSVMGAIASVMMHVQVLQRRKLLVPLNLFVGVVTPPGGGKGVLQFAHRVIQPVDRFIRETSERERAEWRERNLAGPKDQHGPEPRPRFHIYPANISYRALTDILCDNGGYGLMYDTEMLALVNSMKAGEIVDVLLKGFHQEPTAMARMTGLREVPESKFSVVVSGTYDAARTLLGKTGTGLLTRWLLYTSNSPMEFTTLGPGANDDLCHDLVAKLSDPVFKVFEMLWSRRAAGEPVLRVSLTADQVLRVNPQIIAAQAELLDGDVDSYLPACALRAGAYVLKLAAILTLLRSFHDGCDLSDVPELYTDDASVDAAVNLALTSLAHTVRLSEHLPARPMNRTERHRRDFLNSLPNEFDTRTAREVANRVGVKSRTAYNYLNDFIARGILQNVAHGQYRRVE